MRTARHRAPSRTPAAALVGALGEALGLALPTRCAGCGSPDVGLCRRCLHALVGPGRPVDLVTGGWPPWWPRELPLYCVAAYRGPVRAALVAWKDQGRADLTPVVAAGLARAARSGLSRSGTRAGGEVVLVPVPSAPGRVRERGGDLVAAAARRTGLPVAAVLRQLPGAADQAGLGRRARRENLDGRISCRTGVRRWDVLVVDDVVTTGASLAESAGALSAAGAHVLGAATLAGTARTPHGVRAAPLPPGARQGADGGLTSEDGRT